MTRDQTMREVNEITQGIAALATILRQRFNPVSVSALADCVNDCKALRFNVDALGRVLDDAAFSCPPPDDEHQTAQGADVLRFPRSGGAA